MGRTLVRACNQAHILIDVAHAGKRTFWHLCEQSSQPVFSSHSGASVVHPHARNLDDDQLRAIAGSGGIIGVIFVAPYLGARSARFERIADHIEHVAAVAGEDAVALGSDFDGFLPLPRGLRDAADLPGSLSYCGGEAGSRRSSGSCWAKTHCASSSIGNESAGERARAEW